MKYIAQHYTRVNNKVFLPGEAIEEAISPEKAERLLNLGAIRIAGAPLFTPTDESDDGDTEAPDEAGMTATEDENAPEGDAEDEPGTGGEDEYEDAEPPEIDAADSITAPEEPDAEEKKPARSRKGGKEKA